MTDCANIRSINVPVTRTARVALLGPESAAVRELWFVLHGYSELAEPFLSGCRALDNGARLIVAPEALSRFYDAELTAEGHRTGKVGASWMTKEARESEIADYLGYLNALYSHVMALLHGGKPAVTVLGFSQGGATAARWVGEGKVPAKRLVVWGSLVAPDVDIAPGAVLREVDVQLVVGSRDHFATGPVVEKERARLDASGLPYTFRTFDGGHRLDDDTLRGIAGA